MSSILIKNVEKIYTNKTVSYIKHLIFIVKCDKIFI